MNERNKSLIVFLCMASGPMTACDAVDHATHGDVLIGMSPRAEPMNEPNQPNEAVAREVHEQLALAQAAALPRKNVTPTDNNVIGWLRWVLAQPDATGPINDPTGEQCGVGQDGPVWYLAGTYGGSVVRECNIPPGKQLFLPLLNRWCVFPSEFYPTEESIEADLPAILDWYEYERQNTCGLTLRIDGQEVLPDFETMDEELYVQLDELFELDLHDEHWAAESFAGGVMPASGAGHYALIQPLPPGDHVLEFGGSNCGENPWETSATYLLHVGH